MLKLINITPLIPILVAKMGLSLMTPYHLDDDRHNEAKKPLLMLLTDIGKSLVKG